MSTFQSRIEDYIGSYADTNALSEWLTAGAKLISDILPSDELEKFATKSIDSGSGVNVKNARVVSVTKDGYRARNIPLGNSAQVLDTNSIFYATSKSPFYYIKAGLGYCVPLGGDFYLYTYPTVAYTDTSIAEFPESQQHAVVLYASIQGATSNLNTAISSLGAETLKSLTPPSIPSAPSFTYTDASGTTVVVTTIDISSITAPTYTKPTITLATAPSDLSISTSTTPTNPGAFTLLTKVPVAPSSPNITYSDAAIGTFSATTIGNLGAVPTYTQATKNTAISSIPTIGNLETALGNINTPTPPSVPAFTTIALTDVVITELTNDLTINPSSSLPTYIKPVSTANFSNLENYISTEEDFEKANSEAVQQKNKLEQFQMDLYNELNRFNKDAKAYELELQEEIEQVKTNLQKKIQNAQIKANQEVTEATKTLEKEIASYQGELGKYQADIQTYNAQVNKVVQQYAKDIEIWAQEDKQLNEEYGLDIQNNLNSFNNELSIYNSTVQKAIKDAELAQAKILQEAQTTTNLNLQNEAQTLVALIKDYELELNRYQAEIQSYGQEVNAEVSTYHSKLARYQAEIQEYTAQIANDVQEYQANLNKWQGQINSELQQYQGDMQNELNEYQKELAIYNTKVQNAIQNAQLLQQKLLDDAQRADNIDLANKSKGLESQVAEYVNTLQKYQIEVASYQAQVSENVQEYATSIQKYSGQVSSYAGLIATLKAEFNDLIKVLMRK